MIESVVIRAVDKNEGFQINQKEKKVRFGNLWNGFNKKKITIEY